MSTMITLRAIRPLCVGGRRHETGALFELAPLDARTALDGGRCELAQPTDADAITRAVQAETLRATHEPRAVLGRIRG